MKFLSAIILLVIFAFRPVYHIAYIAYFELNIDTIIAKYCINKDNIALQCNGKCHLAKTLTLGSTQKDTKENVMLSIAEAFFPTYYQKYRYRFQTSYRVDFQKNYWDVHKNIIPIYVNIPDPPPKS